MASISVLDRSRRAREEADFQDAVYELLKQLRAHHNSQAKPTRTECSFSYHSSLVNKIDKVLFGK